MEVSPFRALMGTSFFIRCLTFSASRPDGTGNRRSLRMFTNLIESDSHRKEFKRRSSFFLVTVASYSLVLFAAGVASILAYDARLESQTNSLEVLNWIPPAPNQTEASPPRAIQPAHRPIPPTAPVDPHLRIPERTNPNTSTNDPSKVPDTVATSGSSSQTVTGPVQQSDRN